MSEFVYREHLGAVAGNDPTPEAMARMADHLNGAIERRSRANTVPGKEPEQGDVIVVDIQAPTVTPWWRAKLSLLAAAAVVVIVVGVAIAVLSGGENDTDIGPLQEDPLPTLPEESTASIPTTETSAPTEPDPDPVLSESFEGFWSSPGFDAAFEGNLYSLLVGGEVVDQGTFSTIAGSITFRSSASSTSCEDAARGNWGYQFADEDTVSLSFVSDDCDFGRPVGASATLTRVDPFEVP